MEGQLLSETESLCPECLRRIPARKVAYDDKVYLEKTCPEHGECRVLIWRQGAQHYLEWAKGSEKGSAPLHSYDGTGRGCPYDCGLCSEHTTQACTMVMEVTSSCNLRCPVCFASAERKAPKDPDIDTVRGMYEAVKADVGVCTIQLSGGEPTLRDDLPQIVALGREIGFSHILVNTNGVRIARDAEYLRRLKDAGASAIYLQFDGVSDDVYRYTRGCNLLEVKEKALDNCAREGIAAILVPTIVPGVNDHQLGGIVSFAKNRVPTVKGIHFQPVSYLGRYPKLAPSDEDRITIPDVIRALEHQTGGELSWADFIPRRVDEAHCSFSSFFILNPEGKLKALSNLAEGRVNAWGSANIAPEEGSRRFMDRHWRIGESCCESCGPDDNFYRLLNYYLTITCMPFQDVWSVEIERLRGCCGQLVTPERRIVPFCVYYLTDRNGVRLYPGSMRGKD